MGCLVAVVGEGVCFVGAHSRHARVSFDVFGAPFLVLRVGLLLDLLWVSGLAVGVYCDAVGAGPVSVDEMNVGVTHLAKRLRASASGV